MPQMSADATLRVINTDGMRSCAAVCLLITLMCLFGCRDAATIWSTESRSPDGQWVAAAHTDQYGGPGTAGIQSWVTLSHDQDKFEVLQLSQNATSVDLKLKWLSASHLEITYKEPASVDFEATKCRGIEVSVRNLSSAMGSRE